MPNNRTDLLPESSCLSDLDWLNTADLGNLVRVEQEEMENMLWVCGHTRTILSNWPVHMLANLNLVDIQHAVHASLLLHKVLSLASKPFHSF